MSDQYIQIGDTPLSISVYSVKNLPTKKNREGLLEIILCLKGSVLFSYAYEEFTLHAGEFIIVDTDAFYFRKGEDNICVSFYIDLLKYTDKYKYIDHEYFVCEGTPETDVKYYPSIYHERIKGLIFSVLYFLCKNDEANIQVICDEIVDVLVNHFDIVYYHYGAAEIPEDLVTRVKQINHYLSLHKHEKLSLKDIADEVDLTESYISKFMNRMSIGFKGMLGYIRVNASEDLLLNTDKTIIEISEECGFSDVRYYYSAFKKWYRCTPKQFRERYGQEIEAEIKYLPLDSVENEINALMLEHYSIMFMKDIF